MKKLLITAKCRKQPYRITDRQVRRARPPSRTAPAPHRTCGVSRWKRATLVLAIMASIFFPVEILAFSVMTSYAEYAAPLV